MLCCRGFDSSVVGTGSPLWWWRSGVELQVVKVSPGCPSRPLDRQTQRRRLSLSKSAVPAGAIRPQLGLPGNRACPVLAVVDSAPLPISLPAPHGGWDRPTGYYRERYGQGEIVCQGIDFDNSHDGCQCQGDL